MNRLFHIIWREWKRYLLLPYLRRMLLIIPVILFFFYAWIYQEQEIRDLPVAIWDEDQSDISRRIQFLLEQTPSIHITTSVTDQAVLQNKIMSGEISGAIHFPRGMEAAVKSKHPVTVTVYTNAAALVPAKLLYKDAARVIITAGSGVLLQQYLRSGMATEKAMALVQPVKVTAYTLYNPTFNYRYYLVPGLVTVALQMLFIMVSALGINKEEEEGSFAEAWRIAGASPSLLLMGKLLAQVIFSWFHFILIAGILYPLHHLGQPGALVKFFLLHNLLVLACTGLGLFLSVIFRDVMLALDAALFYTSPAFVFSGFTFPRWAMPWYDQVYAKLLPYTHFLDAYIKTYTMNSPLRYGIMEMLMLLLFCFAPLSVAVLVLARRYRSPIAFAS
ncbi:ABC transporter permease [Flavihumibacter petaseus]|uniref:ABC-2 type transporter transmembrane domain-containing protein n=1 Tax=Flavihumibacter petaseus NBRC 106054 TaxID=1220578 RepID=A0A0E9N0I4_9BACT|nr:ABC transporter permease [Flavihumibacter petaseus]GAO43512.1 hypothetical protein FPE01S_02_06170 [Flavihumibacter petaseus NBRC 106054]